MPAVSKKQRRFMAMVEHTPKSELSGKAKEAKSSMSHQQLHDFAKTKEKGLPTRKEKRHSRVDRKYPGHNG
jgi:hypothetical protein